MGKRAVIHCEPRIPWQPKRAAYFAEGFKRRGIDCRITESRHRYEDGFPVLLGTSCWRGIENDGGDYLLVDRCSFGDTEKFVSLVWNGHGRRGDHRIPHNCPPSRWESMDIELAPWNRSGSRVVLCGQTETYSPHWSRLEDWYGTVKATHFKTHPAGSNPTGLPDVRDFENCRCAAVLNSSIAVQCVLAGIPTVTYDEGSMAWDVTGHSLKDIRTPNRLPWCHALAWTQWSDDEIKLGDLWNRLWV